MATTRGFIPCGGRAGVRACGRATIFESLDSTWGFLDRDGYVEPLDELLGARLRESLTDATLRWAITAEPSASLAAPDAPIGVAVRALGSQLAESVTVGAGSVFAGLGDRRLADGGVGLQAADAAPSAAPMAEPDFVPVYARSRGWVFLVGGRTATGAPRGIRRIDVDSGLALDMPLPFEVGRVLAATFDPLRHELVVLDEVVVANRTRVRLLRIDGNGQRGRVLDSWRRFRRFDELSLLIDGDDRLLLSASKDHPKKHRVFELEERNGHIRAHRLLGGPRRLATRPWSNETTLFLALQKANGDVALERVPLPGRSGLGDPEECF